MSIMLMGCFFAVEMDREKKLNSSPPLPMKDKFLITSLLFLYYF